MLIFVGCFLDLSLVSSLVLWGHMSVTDMVFGKLAGPSGGWIALGE